MYYTFISVLRVKQYKVKRFLAEAKKLKITDKSLIDTVNGFMALDMQGQQRHALGAGLYKLRLANVDCRGKSGGSRTILAIQQGKRLIWLHLFAKNNKGNVTACELRKLKMLTDILMGLSDSDVDKLVKSGELLEVQNHV